MEDHKDPGIDCPPSDAFNDAIREQARASDPAHPAWVSANAGSGKTKVLIDRVARLLLKGAAPDSILCITYTKAAANEMLQRLFARLGSWSVMDKDSLAAELSQLEDRLDNPYSDDEIRKARALFARALETPGGLRIETIHAFCTRVLKRFPLEAGLAPGFSQIDEVETNQYWDEALQDGLVDAEQGNGAMLDAVAKAGGGFGAMAGLAAAQQGATALTAFAAQHDFDLNEMDAHLRKALGPPDLDEDALIEHAMAALPTKEMGHAVTVFEADSAKGSKTNAKILRAVLEASSAEDKWALYRPMFFTGTGTFRASVATKGPLGDDAVAALFATKDIPEGSEVQRIKQLDADIKAARAYARTRALIHLTLPVLQYFRARKRQHAAVDFDDLILMTQALLSMRTATDWVLYKLDGGLNHVLLDEAQDTSPAQWSLIQSLTAEFNAGKGKDRPQDPRTLFVVGDEKQSIYSFQGADPAEFLAKRQEFVQDREAASQAAILPEMQMSFRSSPEILTFVDEISGCGDIEGHPYIAGPVTEANYSNHTARRANQPGCVELWPVEVPDAQEDAKPADAPRDYETAASPKNVVALKTAIEVANIIKRGDKVWVEDDARRWSLRPATAGDVLILVNKRTGGLFDAIINALKAQNIPVAGADRLVLADHIGVQDCLNLIRFVLLPSDDLTLAEILRGPFGQLLNDNIHLYPLAYEREDETLWQRLQSSPHPEHQHVTAFLNGLLERRHLPAYEFLSYVLNTPFGDDHKTGWVRLADRLGGPMRDPVQALLKRAIDYDAKTAASLQGFVAKMDLDNTQIKRDLAAPGDEVRVMTVHGAKGLQAPIVILPDTTNPPKSVRPDLLDIKGVPVWAGKSADDTAATALAREHLADRMTREHRRLLYVALTRAQDRLIIFGAWAGARLKPDDGPASKDGFNKSSWYALCAEAMRNLLGDEFPMEDTGRPAFARFGQSPESHAAQAVSAAAGDGPPSWLYQDAPAAPAATRIAAPSHLLADQTPVLPPIGQNRAYRLKRGRLIHALLERLPALPIDRREPAGRAFLDQDTDLSNEQKDDMMNAAMGVLTDPQFNEVFAEGGRAEAPIIGRSPDLPGDLVINGVVDRLIVTDTDVLIVDFKTDQPPPKRAQDVSQTYLTQLAAYAAVLKQAYPNHRVRSALVWTDGPKLMELPENLLANAISRLSVAV